MSTYPPEHCGVAEYTRMLILFLRSLDPSIEFRVYSPKSVRVDEYREPVSGVLVKPAYMKQENSYRGLLDALAEDDGATILHLQHEYGIYGSSIELAERLKEAKRERLVRIVVVTMHTVYHPLAMRHGALEFQRAIGEVADAIIVHSRLQEFELQVEGVDPSKIYRIPHGTLLNPYLGTPRHILLSSLGVDPHPGRWLLTVPGFLRRDKGLDILIEALSMVKARVRVLVAGEVKDRKLLEMLESDERVILIQRYLTSDEILRIVAAADIIVLPYRDKPGTYAVSGILHLSMGALKPIIGARTPRLVELYEYAPRLTVPPQNPRELARKIKWTIQHYDYAVAYASTLYSYAVRTQWARMAARHIGVYHQLLHQVKPMRS